MANETSQTAAEYETNIRQALEVIQSMIDISADRLEGAHCNQPLVNRMQFVFVDELMDISTDIFQSKTKSKIFCSVF